MKVTRQMDDHKLDLKSLSRDYRPGVTEVVGAALAEAAAVCLDSQGHIDGVSLTVSGAFERAYQISTTTVTDRTRRAHAEAEKATEEGACALSILLIDANTELTVVEQSRRGTHFDYWLGQKDCPAPYLQRKARLEVSGIRRGTASVVNQRLNEKLNRLHRSSIRLPAFVSVVEFGSPVAKVVKS